MGRLRHYTDRNTLDDALNLLSTTIEDMNKDYPITSAIINVAIDEGEAGIVYFDRDTGKALILNTYAK